MGEFDLIRRFFQRPVRRAALGVGDDCALLAPGPGMQLAVSCDMLVQGRHFFPDVDPHLLGHKALAVNLSDLAASGATPLAFTLALSLPLADEAWCAAFSEGMFALAAQHDCELIGGDTTAGPLNICITVLGEVPAGQALLRSGARAGDDIWVSGNLGDARLALDALLGRHPLPPALLTTARTRLEAPTPRVALGQALRGVATSALDVSDGLLGDLQHILDASGVGACIDTSLTTPLIAAYADMLGSEAIFDRDYLRQCTLAGGDDYELCFTAPPQARDAVLQAGAASATPVTRIGCIEAHAGLRLVDAAGEPVAAHFDSFDHFAD
ncbi:thiamine-phosphate kinase [Comamonas terrigena]|uniref:thiamine-phosphate kinase n=1 Tax=Comamonas terrigena TaxID=32013 RepID=UPI0028982E06|nr:thiamine-phosphate kinase [Comamonas terrigena]